MADGTTPKDTTAEQAKTPEQAAAEEQAAQPQPAPAAPPTEPAAPEEPTTDPGPEPEETAPTAEQKQETIVEDLYKHLRHTLGAEVSIDQARLIVENIQTATAAE